MIKVFGTGAYVFYKISLILEWKNPVFMKRCIFNLSFIWLQNFLIFLCYICVYIIVNDQNICYYAPLKLFKILLYKKPKISSISDGKIVLKKNHFLSYLPRAHLYFSCIQNIYLDIFTSFIKSNFLKSLNKIPVSNSTFWNVFWSCY